MPYNQLHGGKFTRPSTMSATPFQQYGFPGGASSARDASIAKQSSINTYQQEMINLHGGRRHYKSRSKQSRSKPSRSKQSRSKQSRSKQSRSRRYRKKDRHSKTKRFNTKLMRIRSLGGDISNRRVTVPQFSATSAGPVGPNTISVSGNAAHMQAGANTIGDCFATNTCSQNKIVGGMNAGSLLSKLPDDLRKTVSSFLSTPPKIKFNEQDKLDINTLFSTLIYFKIIYNQEYASKYEQEKNKIIKMISLINKRLAFLGLNLNYNKPIRFNKSDFKLDDETLKEKYSIESAKDIYKNIMEKLKVDNSELLLNQHDTK